MALAMASCSGTEEARAVPDVGEPIRFISPAVGTDWEVGIFNRLRVEPPCYVVVQVSTDGSNEWERTLTLADVTSLQVHKSRNAPISIDDARRDAAAGDAWIDVPLVSLQRANQAQCPSSTSM